MMFSVSLKMFTRDRSFADPLAVGEFQPFALTTVGGSISMEKLAQGVGKVY